MSRFALATIADEGVVVDLESGEIHRVAGAAVAIAEVLARGGSQREAASELVRRFDVDASAALRDVRGVVASLSRRRRRREPWLVFRRRGGAYVVSDLSIASSGVVSRASIDVPLLRLAAPHALALSGIDVLHASAIEVNGAVIAFVGPSGAGKTTMARLSRAPIVSRDLVVQSRGRVVLAGESRIASWSRRRGHEIVPPTFVSERTLPLAAIFVVERGGAFEVVPLRGAEAIEVLFRNAFVEVPDPGVWSRALENARAIAARAIVSRMRVPEGLGALEQALSEWLARRRTNRSAPRAGAKQPRARGRARARS
jgi:hypothetical protein